MADVVGTAFVRIKALTTGLAKDIESSIKKAAKDADVDAPGEDIGERFGKSVGKSFEEKLFAAFGDTTKNIHKKVDVDGGRRIGDRLAEGIRSGLSSIADSSIFKGLQNRIIKVMGLDEASGRKRGRSFGRGLLSAIAKFGALLSPAILGAGSLLVQYVTALTAQLSLLVVAASGAAVALGTVFAAGALGIIPLVLAFKANTAPMKAFKKRAEEIGDAFLEIGAAAQETLLPGLTEALELSLDMIPAFRGFAREIGRSAGEFAKLSVNEVVSDQERLRNILQGSARIFDSLSEVAFNFVSIVLDVFESALPIGEQFADTLERVFDRWQNLIGEAAESGRLTATFQDWYDKAVLVGGALGDLFFALGNIISVGSDSAVPFFENFATWAQDFRTFTDSAAGQNKLKQIFDDALEVAHEFNGLVVDIFEVIGGQVFAEGGNDGIIGFIRVLREDFVPLLDGFATKLKEDYGPALSEFFDAFGEFIVQLSKTDGLNITLQALTGTIQAFTVALETLMEIPGFTAFLSVLIGVGGALKIFGGAFKLLKSLGIVTLVKGLVTVFTTLAFVIGGIATGGAATFIGAFLVGAAVIAAVVAAIVLLIIHIDKVKAALAAVARFFKDPEKRLIALRENIEDLVGSLRDLGGRALGIAGRAIVRFGSLIKEKVEDAIGAVLGFLARLPGMALRALLGLGKTLLNAFVGAVGEVLRALPGLLGKIVYLYVALPLRIAFGLLGLAKTLLEVFVESMIGVGLWLAETGIPAVIGFFTALPGRIAGAMSALSNVLLGLFTRALQGVIDFITTNGPRVVQFFRELPGKIGDFLTDLPAIIVGVFDSAFDAVKTAISDFITVTLPEFGEDMLTAGGNLIDELVKGLSKVISGASRIGRDIANSVIDFINREIIDELNELLTIEFKKGPVNIKVSAPDIPNIPRLSAGGIFSKATLAMIGEAGREVVIPLTNPQRALELFDQSGLAHVLARAQRNNTAMMSSLNASRPGGSVATSTLGQRSGGITIGQMIIEAPTPLESARQVSNRLSILNTQLTRR